MDQHLFLSDGTELRVTRKPVQRINLRIKPDEPFVMVSAPASVPDSDILRLAESKLQWIHRHLGKRSTRPASSQLLPGETVSVWGKSLTICRAAGTGPVTVQAGRLIVPLLPSQPDHAAPAKVQRWLTTQLSDALPELIRSCEERVGRHAAGWQLRSMKSRWGSCTPKTAMIRLNTQLVHYPPVCLQQVMIHELVHLLEFGHNARFYAYMDRFMPDWRRAAAILKGKT